MSRYLHGPSGALAFGLSSADMSQTLLGLYQNTVIHIQVEKEVGIFRFLL